MSDQPMSLASQQNHDNLNDDYLRRRRILDHLTVNSYHHQPAEIIKIVIFNLCDALREKQIAQVSGMVIHDYERHLIQRASSDSFIRILYSVFKVAEQHDIGLMVLLCEEPRLMMRCLDAECLDVYHQRYPPRTQ